MYKSITSGTQDVIWLHLLFYSIVTFLCPIKCSQISYEPDERVTRKPETIFEVTLKSTAKRDEILKYELYQQEGVQYYVIDYPEQKKAKVYRLIDYVYRKMGDFSDETYTFELEKCSIDFNFGFIWRKKLKIKACPPTID